MFDYTFYLLYNIVMRNKVIKEIVLIAIYIALLCVFSWTSIPFVIPFTLQTFMIFVIGFTLSTRSALLTIIIYLLLGVIGVPVFSGFGSGISYILGPTGGFLISFVIQILFISLLSKKNETTIYKIVISLISLFICYSIGLLWFMFVYQTPLPFFDALSKVVLPFIVPDIVKMILALIVSKRLKAYTNID